MKKLTKTNADKYDSLRVKLKEKDVALTQELVDSERFVELIYSIEVKQTQVEVLFKEIKKAGKDPDSIDEALQKTKYVIVIIEEILEIIIVIEQIIVILKGRAKGHPPVLKEIDGKANQVNAAKKKANQTLKAVNDEQKKMLALQQNNKELDTHVQDINSWLPNVESEIVKRTPVSANYDILKKQQEENQVG